jgi:hypothetical protein
LRWLSLIPITTYPRSWIKRKIYLSDLGARKEVDARAKRVSEADKNLVQAFEDSLKSTLGESGAKAIMRLGNVSENMFDAKAMDSSVGDVFGSSPLGLSVMQSNLLRDMSAALNLNPREMRKAKDVGFASSLEVIADRYRLKERAGFGIAGIAAGIISSLCCVGPLALALLGLSSLSSSLALTMAIAPTLKPIELTIGVGFLAATAILQLRKHGECSLTGLRRNLAYVFIPGTTFLLTYALLNYWLGVTFFGGPTATLFP